MLASGLRVVPQRMRTVPAPRFFVLKKLARKRKRRALSFNTCLSARNYSLRREGFFPTNQGEGKIYHMRQPYHGQSPVQEKHVDRSSEHLQQYEAALLAELFRRNSRENSVYTATPPGYRYEQDDFLFPAPLEVDGPIVQVAAHPGDGPDFFYATYLQMATNTQYCNEYHEILLTDGERGVEGWSPEYTRRVRIEEAHAGAALVGSSLHFLGYPDGSLSSLSETLREQVVTELAELIGTIRPRLLVVHPAKTDHPDHASTFFLTVAALQRIAPAGQRPPTLLIHDVEFGLQQKSLWINPADDHFLHFYAMHSPEFIVDISATYARALQALFRHKTQMYDPVHERPKLYADLIGILAQVRGLQCMPEKRGQLIRGQGFSHIVIPGITSEHNVLPFRLPAQCLYRRVKNEDQNVDCRNRVLDKLALVAQ
jgi:LmbE family N-acetylglucosaminyl deacetylase